VADCSVELLNSQSCALRVVWCGWMVMSDDGEWQEVRSGWEFDAGGIDIPAGGTLNWKNELVPLEGIRSGAMWACVAVDPDGGTHYGECILDRAAVPRRWRKVRALRDADRGVGSGDRGGLHNGGVAVGHRHIPAGEIISIHGGMTLVGRLRKDHAEPLFSPYTTEISNCANEPLRVVWMQTYEMDDDGFVRGRNIMGRALGPEDSGRWFVAGEGRSGRIYHGEGEILLDRPLNLEELMCDLRD
jgi:hypothetical protein